MILIPLQYAEAHVAKRHTNTKAAVPEVIREPLQCFQYLYSAFNLLNIQIPPHNKSSQYESRDARHDVHNLLLFAITSLPQFVHKQAKIHHC